MLFPNFEANTWWGVAAVAGFYIVGLLHVLHALMHVRTSQGTIAWVVSLLTMPFLAIPLYWMLGRTRFSRNVGGRRDADERLGKLAEAMYHQLRRLEVEIPQDDAFEKAAQVLGGLPFTRGNELELLIDGERTFQRIFEVIEKAESYLCVNFYIVKNDMLGTRFQQALIERARAGVKVYFLFDEIGSHKLPRRYLKQMRDAGIRCKSFGINRFWWSRLQLNFRNHRKIVVSDGTTAFIGGLNVGDEYMGHDKRFGHWRDTHLKLRGPVVQAVQLVFLEDWFWASGQVPELRWQTRAKEAEHIAQTAVDRFTLFRPGRGRVDRLADGGPARCGRAHPAAGEGGPIARLAVGIHLLRPGHPVRCEAVPLPARIPAPEGDAHR